jgi:hypothetical protein
MIDPQTMQSPMLLLFAFPQIPHTEIQRPKMVALGVGPLGGD